LAGPVSVGVAAAPLHALEAVFHTLAGVKDSKKLSHQKRERWCAVARELKERKELLHTVSLVGVQHINKRGIAPAVRIGVKRSLERLKVPPEASLVLLDGGLRAPSAFIHQQTIIGGDDTEPLISLASILAKERRDTYMQNLSRKMPQYGFEQHKGYGTHEHMRRIRLHGISSVHRTAFVHL